MTSGDHHHRRHLGQVMESFRIKHDEDDKFLSRLLSKESSRANNVNNPPSFRVYYGNVSGSVPFMWESRPGTPKHTFSDNTLPPLTPPPSYYNSNTINTPHLNKNKKKRNHSRSRFLHALFLKIHRKNCSDHISSSSSSSSSSLSSLSWSSSNSCKRKRLSSWGSSSEGAGADQLDVKSDVGSWTPGRCFGMNRNQENGHGVLRVGYSFVVKKALLSIVGRASS